jgi:hypothetical protein
MNKQELIERIKKLPFSYIWDEPYLNKEVVLEAVEQLDEPQKVTIPQFVADYIDISKFYVRTLHYALENSPEKVNLWLCKNEINRQNTFAHAWLDGYEVEEEKRYIIKFKNIQKGTKYLKYDRVIGKWYFGLEEYSTERSIYHTKKELEEAGFGWVFDCEGIEIEEVTE